MNYSPSKKNLVVALALSLLMVGIFVGMMAFLYSKIQAFDEAIYQSTKYTQNSDRTFRLRREVEELSQSLDSLHSFFIRPGEEAYFLEKLESLAKSLGVKMQTESVFEGKTARDGYLPLQVGIRFEGEWAKVSEFIKSVEEMPYAVEASNTTLSLNSDGAWAGTMVLNVYKWPK